MQHPIGASLTDLGGGRDLDALAQRVEALLARGEVQLYGTDTLTREAGVPFDWFGRWGAVRDGELFDRARHDALGEDIKDVWELGRCAWVLDLICADAAGLSPRADLADFFHQQVAAFAEQHDERSVGVHFSSGQECAIRSARLVLGALAFDRGCAQDFALIERVLYAHGRFIEAQIDFARFATPNNHLIAEAMALYMLGESFNGWEESARWRELAMRLLVTEISEQFTPARLGARGYALEYTQASHTYHRFALELLSWWRVILREDETAHARALLDELIAGSARALSWWMWDLSTGTLPNFGANDGARFLPLTGSRYEDFRDALCGMQVMQSARFDGVYVKGLRTRGWGVAIRTGEVRGTASQVDMGHVELWHDGEAIAIDRGSLRYHDASIHDRYSGPRGHNVLRFRGARFGVQRVGRFLLAHVFGEGGWSSGVEGDRVWLIGGTWRPALFGRMHREVVVKGPTRVHVRDGFVLCEGARGVLRWQLAGVVTRVDEGALCAVVELGARQVELRVTIEGARTCLMRRLREDQSRRYGEARAMDVVEVEFEPIALTHGAQRVEILTEFVVCASS